MYVCMFKMGSSSESHPNIYNYNELLELFKQAEVDIATDFSPKNWRDKYHNYIYFPILQSYLKTVL